MCLLFHPSNARLTQLLGHKDAWEKAGILHRDVSVGNIMIDVTSTEEDFKAFLNDWDLCKYKEDIRRGVRQHAGISVGYYYR